MSCSKIQSVQAPKPKAIGIDSLSEREKSLVVAEESLEAQLELVPSRRSSFEFRDNVYNGKIARIPEGYIGFSPASTDIMLCFEQSKLFVEVEEPECQKNRRLHAKLLSWCGTKSMNVYQMVRRQVVRLKEILNYIPFLAKTRKK